MWLGSDELKSTTAFGFEVEVHATGRVAEPEGLTIPLREVLVPLPVGGFRD
jgi:hypothetical protein